jgi:hypothetical protein
MTDEVRRKPLDVALAEGAAWRQGLLVVGNIKKAYLRERKHLLDVGFPAGHALCEDLDKGAEKWAAIETNMRRDYHHHIEENQIRL